MKPILLDSNILIAYLDIEHIHHKLVAQRIDESKAVFSLSTISISECLVRAYEFDFEYVVAYQLSFDEIVSIYFDLDQAIAFNLAEIKSRNSVDLGDAIIWATADLNKLELWTLDRRLANKYKNSRYLLAG